MRARPVLWLLLLALASVAVCGDYHEHQQDHHEQDQAEQDHSEDFTKIDHRLDKLTARVEAVKHSVRQRVDPGTIKKARSLRQRVQQLEGMYT